jgi:hypothetical protein
MTKTVSSIGADGVFEPFATDVVPWEEFAHGERFGVRFQQLGEFGGGSHIGVCMEVLAAGKRTYPAHFHMLEEEHLMILEGTLTLRLGEKCASREGTCMKILRDDRLRSRRFSSTSATIKIQRRSDGEEIFIFANDGFRFCPGVCHGRRHS